MVRHLKMARAPAEVFAATARAARYGALTDADRVYAPRRQSPPVVVRSTLPVSPVTTPTVGLPNATA